MPPAPLPAATLRAELMATGLFRRSGKHTLESVPLDEQNVQTALQVLELSFGRMDEVVAQKDAP